MTPTTNTAGRAIVTGPIVTLQEAKDQLDISHAFRDPFIQSKIDDATGIVLAWLNFNLPDTPWDPAGVPHNIRAAVLLVLADQFANRGTDDDRDDQQGAHLSYRVRSMLAPWHVQTVA